MIRACIIVEIVLLPHTGLRPCCGYGAAHHHLQAYCQPWVGVAGRPPGGLFVLIFITFWLSSHLLPVLSYLYQIRAALLSLAVISHILRMPRVPRPFTCVHTGNPSPLSQGELLLCPSAWLVRCLPLDWEPWPSKHTLEHAQGGRDS